MLKKQVKLGRFYQARISQVFVTVRLDGVSRFGGWDATNMNTGRQIRIKSAGKLRKEVTWQSV